MSHDLCFVCADQPHQPHPLLQSSSSKQCVRICISHRSDHGKKWEWQTTHPPRSSWCIKCVVLTPPTPRSSSTHSLPFHSLHTQSSSSLWLPCHASTVSLNSSPPGPQVHHIEIMPRPQLIQLPQIVPRPQLPQLVRLEIMLCQHFVQGLYRV